MRCSNVCEPSDKAVSCVRYLFDPDNKSMKWATGVITAHDESLLPEFEKVIHYNGRRYVVYLNGKKDTPEKRKAAMNLFKQFYLNKLADAAEEVSKFSTILTFFK